jgi:hypothetical protein
MITTEERRQMARALQGRRTDSRLAAPASTGVTNLELRLRAQTLVVPSARAKLLSESGASCTPLCLESIEGQPADYYVGTNSTGAIGVWPLPTGSSTSGIAAPPGTAAPKGVITGSMKGQMYTQTDPTGTYILRQWVFNGEPGTNTNWL